MSLRSTLLLAGAVVAAALAALLLTHEVGLGEPRGGPNPAASRAHPFLLEDTYDRLAYQQRGRWLASGGTPYLDEFSEYPQLTTWLMGLPYLVIEHGVERGEPHGSIRAAWAELERGGVPPEVARELCPLPPAKMPDVGAVATRLARFAELDRAAARGALEAARAASQRRDEELLSTREAYGSAHHVTMACWYLVLLTLAALNLRRLGHAPGWALLLLLPASLYFGFNRFDLVVTSLVALALHLQLSGRRRGAGFVLGVAIMTKWSPIVLLPLFLSQNVRLLRAPPEPGAEPADWRTALIQGAIVPGALAGVVIVALLGVTFFWHGGGVDAVRFVFDWHANVRQPNHSSFLAILTNPDSWGWFEPSARGSLERVFKLLQLAPGFLLALLPVRSNRALLLGCLTATLFSIVFSEFFSPQWVIWVTALGLLLAPRSRLLLALVVALEVVMYVQLPYLWYAAQASGDFASFWTITSVRMALLLVFLAVALALFVRELLAARGSPYPRAS
ncbi:MAG: glycosyltransferase family 87 protein [Planctomycetota bacterium]